MDEIKTGDALLSYACQLIDTLKILHDAYTVCNRAKDRVDADMYEGRALDEMKQFFGSLTIHVGQLMTLYQTGLEYVRKSYQTMHRTDDELVQMYLAKLEGKEAEENAGVSK